MEHPSAMKRIKHGASTHYALGKEPDANNCLLSESTYVKFMEKPECQRAEQWWSTTSGIGCKQA